VDVDEDEDLTVLISEACTASATPTPPLEIHQLRHHRMAFHSFLDGRKIPQTYSHTSCRKLTARR